MQKTTQTYNLDIQKAQSQVCIDLHRGDTAVKLCFILSDGGSPYNITEDCGVKFVCKKSDNTIIFNSCSVVDGMIFYEVSSEHPQLTAAVGLHYCELRVYSKKNGEQLTSACFGVLVDDTTVSEGEVIESANDVELYGVIWSGIGRATVEGGEIFNDCHLRQIDDGIAEGNVANALFSHAEGSGTTASGENSHSEGRLTIASGHTSHAEGFETQATATNAHSEGRETVASGTYGSHAEGYQTKALGRYSHAEGYGTTAGVFDDADEGGRASHSEGWKTSALGEYSHAGGTNTTALGRGAMASGGSYVIAADLGITPNMSTDEISSNWSKPISDKRCNVAAGDYSHSEGYNTLALGTGSHAEGRSSKASGNYSHAEGNISIASGSYSHAEGEQTTASGTYSHAEGSMTTASGLRSFAAGRKTTASGTNSAAFGQTTKASAENQFAVGKYNKENSDALFIVGNGSSGAAKLSNAFEVMKDGSANVKTQGVEDGSVVIMATLKERLGEIESVLDSIIAIQNSLIGGEAE